MTIRGATGRERKIKVQCRNCRESGIFSLPCSFIGKGKRKGGKKKKMKRKDMFWAAPMLLVGIFLMAGIASAHSLYMVTDDTPTIPVITPVKQDVAIFFGHPDAADSFRIMPMQSATLHKPDGSTVALNLKEEGNYLNAELVLDQQGDYFVTASREPAVYNPVMHGGEDSPQLIYDYPKVIIHAGVEENWDNVIGQELEIVPLVNPYDLHVGDTFTAQLLYKGKPVRGEYDAAHENESLHDPEEAQIGETDDDGMFSITINNPGMWLIQCAYSIEEPGTWTTAQGEEERYDSKNYRATMTLLPSAGLGDLHNSVESLEQSIEQLGDAHLQAVREIEQLKGKTVTPAYTAIGLSIVAILLAIGLPLVRRKK